MKTTRPKDWSAMAARLHALPYGEKLSLDPAELPPSPYGLINRISRERKVKMAGRIEQVRGQGRRIVVYCGNLPHHVKWHAQAKLKPVHRKLIAASLSRRDTVAELGGVAAVRALVARHLKGATP